MYGKYCSQNKLNLILEIVLENVETLQLFTFYTNYKLLTKLLKIQALFGLAWVEGVNLKIIRLNNILLHFVLMCDANIVS